MKYLFLLFTLLTIQFTHAQSSILIDGEFADWQSNSPLFMDGQGDDGISQIDFGSLWVYDDSRFLYINIEVGEEINLQDGNEVNLLIDTDNNASTGLTAHGIGAELSYTFGQREGVVYPGNSQLQIFHSDIDLVSAPTVSSDQFELVISKDVTFLGQSLFAGDSIRIVIRDVDNNGDLLPDAQGGVLYGLNNTRPVTLPSYSLAKQDSQHFRVLSYNVLNDGLFDPSRTAAMARVLAAIKPDLIGFQEIYNNNSQQVANEIENILPSATGEQWYHQQQGSDIIAISRYPILGHYGIDNNGAFLIDMTEAIGSELLFIVAHPPCCSNNEGRQQEIDAIMAFVRDVKSGTGVLQLEDRTPILIVGDMNLVGYKEQLRTLLTGDIVNEQTYGPDFSPDWDTTALEDAQPLTTGLPMKFTWFRESSSFSPGRLDFIVYSGSVMEMVNQFTLFSRGLSQDSLSAYQLLAEDAIVASDHLPVVADFSVVQDSVTSSRKDLTEASLEFSIQPNPFSSSTQISYILPKASHVQLSLHNQAGQKITALQEGWRAPGSHFMDFHNEALTPGIYFLILQTESLRLTRKIMIR